VSCGACSAIVTENADFPFLRPTEIHKNIIYNQRQIKLTVPFHKKT